MFAAYHRLGNLTVVLDWNGQQALGLTRDVLDLGNMAERWAAFGWRTTQVDGHSIAALVSALNQQPDATGSPHIVLARTVFGRGVSYMEKGLALSREDLPVAAINWHYLPMSESEYRIALAEVEGTR